MASMRRAIQAAISKGVPTFNAGDHAGCAAIYRACAEQLEEPGRDNAVLRRVLRPRELRAHRTHQLDAG